MKVLAYLLLGAVSVSTAASAQASSVLVNCGKGLEDYQTAELSFAAMDENIDKLKRPDWILRKAGKELTRVTHVESLKEGEEVVGYKVVESTRRTKNSQALVVSISGLNRKNCDGKTTTGKAELNHLDADGTPQGPGITVDGCTCLVQ